MPDVLMTVCTYDDEEEAWRDCRTLEAAGIQSNVRPCLWIDPENPGVRLVDVVVFDEDLARAQDILQVCPPEPEEVPNPGAIERGQWAALIVLLVLAVLAGVVFIVSF